jgi:AcrR family transcriptional regulator
MSIQKHRERERAEREKLIISAARELAEAEGWDAVTTRRLAERIEYSQPVLYSHFKGKGEIMAAVAVEGCAMPAEELHAVRVAAPDLDRALAGIAAAYTDFAERHPALYDVIFNQDVDLPFATPQAPAALQAAFNELADGVRPHAGDDDLGTLTETFWAALHGLVTLTRGRRLPREQHDHRLALFLARFGGGNPGQTVDAAITGDAVTADASAKDRAQSAQPQGVRRSRPVSGSSLMDSTRLPQTVQGGWTFTGDGSGWGVVWISSVVMSMPRT